MSAASSRSRSASPPSASTSALELLHALPGWPRLEDGAAAPGLAGAPSSAVQAEGRAGVAACCSGAVRRGRWRDTRCRVATRRRHAVGVDRAVLRPGSGWLRLRSGRVGAALRGLSRLRRARRARRVLGARARAHASERARSQRAGQEDRRGARHAEHGPPLAPPCDRSWRASVLRSRPARHLHQSMPVRGGSPIRSPSRAGRDHAPSSSLRASSRATTPNLRSRAATGATTGRIGDRSGRPRSRASTSAAARASSTPAVVLSRPDLVTAPCDMACGACADRRAGRRDPARRPWGAPTAAGVD